MVLTMEQSHWDRAFAARTFRKSTTITSASVIAALGAGSGAVAISLGTPPPGAYLLDWTDRVTANFTGGSISGVTGSVGTASDPDQVAGSMAMHTGTVGGAVRNGTAGINPKGLGYGGTELFLTLTPAGAELSALTSGAAVVDMLFAVPDGNPGL